MPVYRTLIPAESARYRAHLLRLAPDDRRARFMGAVADESLIRHVQRISWTSTLVVAAIHRGEVRAAAELRLGDGPDSPAELAVSVEADWQGQGIGKALTRRIMTMARNRGARQLTMICLSENRRMQRIADRLMGPCRWEDGDIVSTVFLPPPTPLSLTQEIIDTGAVPMAMMLDHWAGPARVAA